jgi:hypothetical protein
MPKTDMQKPCTEREPGMRRTLDQLAEHHTRFLEAGAITQKAKNVPWNVINPAMYNVPVNQVNNCTVVPLL